jgi:hypothetical protein
MRENRSRCALKVKMQMPALALIAIGVLLTAAAFAPSSWDLAVAVMPGWHVTIFPAPLWVGAIVMLIGIVTLLVSFR